MAGNVATADRRRLMPTGLYARTLLIIVVPMLLLQAAAAYIFLERHWERVTERLSDRTASEVALLSDFHRRHGDGAQWRRFAAQAAERLEMEIAFVSGASLPEGGGGFSSLLDRALRESLRRRLQGGFWIDTGAAGRRVEMQIEAPGGVLKILAPRNRVYATKTYLFIFWMAVVSAVLLAISILFLRNQIRPIQRLAVAARKLGRGGEVVNFRARGAREVREAAAAFFEMRDRIRRHLDQRTTMLAGVSHDLRTPLTRFKLQLALLPRNAETEALRDDVAQMEQMLDAYLDFARGARPEAPRAVDVAGVIRRAAQGAAPGATIGLALPGALTARVDVAALERCLDNLIGNACAYGGGRIEIGAERGKAGIEIRIDDDGPGIAEELREEAFRPFHRLDAARNQDRAGTGLGLAIARDAMRGGGGDVVLEQSPLGGLRAVILLPG